MNRFVSITITLLSILALAVPAIDAKSKKKKDDGLTVLFESMAEMVETGDLSSETTTLSREELEAAGYVATGRVRVESVIRVCRFKKDRTEKCKDAKNVKDGREELLALVLKNGGGLVLMDEEVDERKEALIGKECVHWRPNATNAVPDCAQWSDRQVGYELIRIRSGTVWNLQP